MEKNNKLAHISDIHIRFGSRHDEYRVVFNRLIKDLQKEKPRRIIFTGDLFHLKINLSPTAIEMAAKLLSHLSKIAPVDILLGNHDLNEQDLTQGNAIKPLIDIMENGYVITSEDKTIPKPATGHGVYFFHDSGFYHIDEDIEYGIYSLWDHELLTLSDKKLNKKYIALYHGPVYGCMSDSGFQMKGDELVKLSTFNNFDMVMLGDIHEYQTFERAGRDDVAYSGSLLQQNMGESIEKGYLIWDLETCTHERRFILNDYGFCKLNISKGEDIWERIDTSIKLSFVPKKTKVIVEIEDDAENENIELKSQVKKYIKTKYKCESVEVDFKKISREKVLGVNTDTLDLSNQEVFRQLLESYLKENNYENIDDVLSFSDEIDVVLNLTVQPLNHLQWDLNKMVTYNIFSHPAKETVFDFDKMQGVVGIFGKNYSGKSNIIKALVWGLYEKVLGGGDKHKVVNLYTGVNKAYVHIYFTAAGMQYRSKRSVTVTTKKDGSTAAAYNITYDYAITDDNGNIISWEPENSERAAKEKPEVKKLITEAIGTFENFTKVSLQTQGGKDDYLSLSQQPKNDLFREYMNLSPCDLRYEAANKKFNQVKALQKNLGDPAEIEATIVEAKKKIEEENEQINFYNTEKVSNTEQIEIHTEEILELTKQLIKIDDVGHATPESLTLKIEQENSNLGHINEEIYELDVWIRSNFSKEIPEGLQSRTVLDISTEIEQVRNRFNREKEDFLKIKTWLDNTIKKKEINTEPTQEKIDALRAHCVVLKNDILIARGEKCPTCGNVSRQPDPSQEKLCIENLAMTEQEIVSLQNFIKEQREVVTNNNLIDKENNKLDALKNTLQASKLQIDELKMLQDKVEKIQDDVKHNKQVAQKTAQLQNLRSSAEEKRKLIEDLTNQLNLLLSNAQAIEHNITINDRIKTFQESVRQYKLVNFQFDEKLRNSYGNIKVQENNVDNFTEKLNQIRESVRVYNKYSIYLQAVSRDGIPAQIIRKRLPMVNYRINTILRNIVNFKIDMYVKSNGDVQEVFYFNDDKTDSLPLSMGSGSQKFIGSVAIRDALHYISCLIKPSFCIIDEGFGTLDEDKTADVNNIFGYLKNKYKNVFIITHKNEIKDYVEHIIAVSKTQSELPQSVIDSNPEAGISQFSFT